MPFLEIQHVLKVDLKMRILLLFSLMFPVLAQSSALKSESYKSVKCVLSYGEKVVKEVSSPMMAVQVEETIGRFVQIQFQQASAASVPLKQNQLVQYQLFLEDDLKIAGNIIVLQNLLVGKNEVSAEFTASELNWVRVAGQDYSVKCEILK